MKSILSIAAAMLLGSSTAVASREYPAAALQYRQWGALVYSGCYSSSEGSAKNSTIQFNSKGACQAVCLPTGAAVLSVQDADCYCGDELPPKDSLVDDSKCITTCPGYGVEKCGADGYWTVYLTSTETDVPYADSSAVASSSSTTAATSSKAATATQSAPASVVTIGGQTVVVTAPANSSSTSSASSSSSGGPNKAAIAAGIVVGVVAIAAIAGGIFLFLRQRRNRAVEEEYRRNAAVSSFIAGGSPPKSSGGASSFDTRLDPVMAQRRMSDGSIADNQDYSRRILKVTNA